MGAIYGIFNFDSQDIVKEDIIRKIGEKMRHRGPDEEGIYLDKNIGLGNRRLKVIGLGNASQPITNEDKSIFVITDGSIYNYLELKGILEKRGHRFSTNSDAEVLVHLYEDKGKECVKEINGEVCFALWDAKQRMLLLARDRLGTKPLYYSHSNAKLIFSSELDGILQTPDIRRDINLIGMHHYLTYSFVPAPETMVLGINRLLPAHILNCKDGKMSIEKYWNLADFEESKIEDEEYYIEKIKELLIDAVRIRLRGDVAVGTFLSGGHDTSTLVAIMSMLQYSPIHTYTIAFDDPHYDESPYADIVANHFKTQHHKSLVKFEDAMEILPKVISCFDQPCADDAALGIYKASEMVKAHSNTVLNGEIADELFCGVGAYKLEERLSLYSQRYKSIPQFIRRGLLEPIFYSLPDGMLKGKIGKWKRGIKRIAIPEIERLLLWGVINENETKNFLYSQDLKKELEPINSLDIKRQYFNASKAKDTLNKRLYVDITLWFPNGLHAKNEAMAMGNSIELRSPFADYRLVEFAATIPGKLKLKDSVGKYIYKKAVFPWLPEETRQRKKWHGFIQPTKGWFQGELGNFTKGVLFESKTIQRGYFNPKSINQLLKEHEKGIRDNRYRIWALLILELWIRKHIDKE